MPQTNDGVLALHDLHRCYSNFEEFQQELPALLQQGTLLDDCIAVTRALGILEPLSGEYIPPEAIKIQGPNYRESLVANGLLSRNRALLGVLQQSYGSLDALVEKDVYLVEALSGFAQWMQRHLLKGKLTCSEYLDEAEFEATDVLNEDLCALSFSDARFDVVLCNELFEHVPHLEVAFREIVRVLRSGGRLIATCPMAFGQRDSIMKATHNPETGLLELIAEPERHGDPIRPAGGSLVYRIPGWEILEQMHAAGFSLAQIHHLASWKYGVLGSDLAGVLVIEGRV